jgi:hypothetical protein
MGGCLGMRVPETLGKRIDSRSEEDHSRIRCCKKRPRELMVSCAHCLGCSLIVVMTVFQSKSGGNGPDLDRRKAGDVERTYVASTRIQFQDAA